MLGAAMPVEQPTMMERVHAVQARIDAACKAASRAPTDVRLIAVSKKKSPDFVSEAMACGLSTFGENRVQEARAKIPDCPQQAEWHLIGTLQRNKAAAAVELFSCIHSIDRVPLLQRIDTLCGEQGRQLQGLLQVNVAGEASKHGATIEDMPELVEAACACRHIDIIGLMTIPPAAAEPQAAAPHFAALRKLRDDLQSQFGLPLPELSMGMSHDFETAISEGATMIRVGTALFGART